MDNKITEKNMQDFKSLLKSYPQNEISGIIDSSGNVVMHNIGGRNHVNMNRDIEKDITVIPFHTHPSVKTDKDSYFFHSEADMFESFRRFFNSGNLSYSNLVVSEYGIVNLSISSDKIIEFSPNDIQSAIFEISEYSNNYYPKVFTMIMGDNGAFDKDDFSINEEQFKILSDTNLEKRFNSEMNKGLEYFGYLKNLKIEMKIIKPNQTKLN